MSIEPIIKTLLTREKDSSLNESTNNISSKDTYDLLYSSNNALHSSSDSINISSLFDSSVTNGFQIDKERSSSLIQNNTEAKVCVSSILSYLKNDSSIILNSVVMSSSTRVLNLIKEFTLQN